MNRGRATLVGFLAMVLLAAACSDSGEATAPCPEGFTESTSTSELTSGHPTREEAIRAELDRLEAAAQDEAITEATIGGSPGPSPGSEVVVVDTDELGDVRMTLEPLEPGWAVGRSRWCAPI